MRGSARGSASGLRQGSALHPRRVFDPLDTHLAIELVTFSCYARVFIHRIPTLSPVSTSYGTDQQQECALRRGQGGDRRRSSVFIAPLSLPQERNPLQHEKSSRIGKKHTPKSTSRKEVMGKNRKFPYRPFYHENPHLKSPKSPQFLAKHVMAHQNRAAKAHLARLQPR